MCPAVGKRGKRRNCPWKGPITNEWRGRSTSRSDGFPAVMFRRLPKPSLLVCRRIANESDNDYSFLTPIIRRNDARRCMVDSAPPGFYWIVDFHYLFHLGCVSGKELFLRQLHLAVLFAGNFLQFASLLVLLVT